jgi:hypothetical protein
MNSFFHAQCFRKEWFDEQSLWIGDLLRPKDATERIGIEFCVICGNLQAMMGLQLCVMEGSTADSWKE